MSTERVGNCVNVTFLATKKEPDLGSFHLGFYTHLADLWLRPSFANSPLKTHFTGLRFLRAETDSPVFFKLPALLIPLIVTSSSKLGDRDLYQRYYRAAFESGYDTENPGFRNNRNDDYDRNRNNQNNQTRQRRWGRNWDLYGQFGGSYELRQTALNAGYNNGVKEGRNDRKKNRSRSYSEFSSYREATIDYSSKLGDKELYRRYFRQGFENGYEDGYRGY